MYVLDCDGVILDWCEGFKKYCDRYSPGIGFKTEYPKSHELSEWLQFPIGAQNIQSKIANLIRQFNSSPEFISLNPVNGASDFLKHCYYNDIKYKILTSCGSSYTTVIHRLLSLQLAAGEDTVKHDNLICIELGQPKTGALKALRNMGYSIFVDDHPGHVNSAEELGYTAHLFNTEANIKLSGMYSRIDSLMDLIK